MSTEIRRVRNLKQILEVVKNNFEDNSVFQRLTDAHKHRLLDIVRSCENVLRDLVEELSKCKELETNSKPGKPNGKPVGRNVRMVWRRLNCEPDVIKQLRDRITSNVSSLDAFQGQLTAYDIPILHLV